MRAGGVAGVLPSTYTESCRPVCDIEGLVAGGGLVVVQGAATDAGGGCRAAHQAHRCHADHRYLLLDDIRHIVPIIQEPHLDADLTAEVDHGIEDGRLVACIPSVGAGAKHRIHAHAVLRGIDCRNRDRGGSDFPIGIRRRREDVGVDRVNADDAAVAGQLEAGVIDDNGDAEGGQPVGQADGAREDPDLIVENITGRVAVGHPGPAPGKHGIPDGGVGLGRVGIHAGIHLPRIIRQERVVHRTHHPAPFEQDERVRHVVGLGGSFEAQELRLRGGVGP